MWEVLVSDRATNINLFRDLYSKGFEKYLYEKYSYLYLNTL